MRISDWSSDVCSSDLMITGCLLVRFVIRYQDFSLILCALFVLGTGITTLQVAANPLAAALGPPETSHFRLTFAQAFNSLGVVLGVNFGSRIMLDARVLTPAHPPTTNHPPPASPPPPRPAPFLPPPPP